MEIFIFRHADKDFSSEGDPGLSLKGHNQAQKILKAVEEKKLPKPNALWVSPKRRAQETFEPLAESLQTPLKIYPQLDQRLYEESPKDFINRIRGFIKNTISKDKNSILFLCTHSDWIESIEIAGPLNQNLDFHTLLMPSAHYLQFTKNEDDTWDFLNKSGFN